jgi:hypothetical protein
MEYLTPEDFETAKKNGISEVRAKARFYRMAWSKQRAITQEVRKPRYDWAEYKDRSLVTEDSFYKRIRKGMTPEEAALTPPTVRLFQPVKITKTHIERAANNGITLTTLSQRVYKYRWNVERAVTEPIHVSKRKKLDRAIEVSTN